MTDDIRTTKGKISDLRHRVEASQNVASSASLEKRKAAGKMTARERLVKLLDVGSFVEFDAFSTHHADKFGMDKSHPLGDGVVTGYGTIDGRTVAVYAQDFLVLGGSLGERMGRKITKDRKSTRLNSSHTDISRIPSSA